MHGSQGSRTLGNGSRDSSADTANSDHGLRDLPIWVPARTHWQPDWRIRDPGRSTEVRYRIHSSSSHSNAYTASNIMIDNPFDQTSRWSSASPDPTTQYILLELLEPAVVQSITFGKFSKNHVCNLKEFRILGGQTPDSSAMVELLHGGLRNDSLNETLALRTRYNNGLLLVVKYIKIQPTHAHGANFNFSIWYVQLRGIVDTPSKDDPRIIKRASEAYDRFRETRAVRIALKFLRKRGYDEAFNALQGSSAVRLEDLALQNLHEQICVSSSPHEHLKYQEIERSLELCQSSGMFDEYIQRRPYRAQWKRILDTDANGVAPSARGGHSMVFVPPFDSNGRGSIYLFGGFDGTKDLADFWLYEIPAGPGQPGRWKCLAQSTAAQGGPSARSCHKMALCETTGEIYMLGRYVEQSSNTVSAPNGRARTTSGQNLVDTDMMGNSTSYSADFWRYSISSMRWEKLTGNTAAEGGPELIYDHQVSIDSVRQVMYCFGGRLVRTTKAGGDAGSNADPRYSGLYAFDLVDWRWSLIRSDNMPSGSVHDADKSHARMPVSMASTSPTSVYQDGVLLLSRIGHSMVLDSKRRQLYILAGQRMHEYLSELFAFDLDSGKVVELARDVSKVGGPDATFTSRATIDEDAAELHLLAGISKHSEQDKDNAKNSIWIYDLVKSKWTLVYTNENTLSNKEYWERMRDVEPMPRFASHLIYDKINKTHYLFGGNALDGHQTQGTRMDDFWRLQLTQPDSDEILRQAKLLIRRQVYRELCKTGHAFQSMQFLRNELYSVTNHEDPKESEDFQRLSRELLSTCIPTANSASTTNGTDIIAVRPSSVSHEVQEERLALFEDLMRFFPENLRQPPEDLDGQMFPCT